MLLTLLIVDRSITLQFLHGVAKYCIKTTRPTIGPGISCSLGTTEVELGHRLSQSRLILASV